MGNSGTEVHPAWLAKSCSKHRRIGFRLAGALEHESETGQQSDHYDCDGADSSADASSTTSATADDGVTA